MKSVESRQREEKGRADVYRTSKKLLAKAHIRVYNNEIRAISS